MKPCQKRRKHGVRWMLARLRRLETPSWGATHITDRQLKRADELRLAIAAKNGAA